MSVLVFGQATGGNQSAAASFGLNLTGTVPANAVLVVAIAADNAGASGASAISSVSDNFGLGNVWSLVKAQNRTAGSAANDGCTAALYVSRVPGIVDVSAGTKTVTVNFSPNVTAKAVAIVHVTGVEDIAYSTNGVSGTGTTYNSAATASASMAVGDLFLGVVASESNTIPTADSDSTGGTWGSAQTAQSGGAGGDATKMSVSLQFKLPSGSGAQTLNGACANSDWAVAWGLFTVPVAKSDTETASSADAGESVNTGAQPSDADTGTAVDAEVRIGLSDAETGSGADAGEAIVVPLSSSDLDNRFFIRAVQGTNGPSATQSAVWPAGSNNGSATATPWFTTYTLGDRDDTLGGQARLVVTLGQTALQSGTLICAASAAFGVAGTFGAGTWSVALNAVEGGANANAFFGLSIFVWDQAGGTLRGRIYDSTSALGSEIVTGGFGSQVFTVTGADVAVQATDVLCVEVWYRAAQADTTAYNIQLFINGTTPIEATGDPATGCWLQYDGGTIPGRLVSNAFEQVASNIKTQFASGTETGAAADAGEAVAVAAADAETGAAADAGEALAAQITDADTGAVGVLFSDSFDRADSPSSLGTTDCAYGGTPTPWLPLVGTWGVIGNEAYESAGALDALAVIEAGRADCTVELTLPAIVATSWAATWRVVDALNFWVLAINPDANVYRKVAGTYTLVATLSVTPVSGDVVKIVLEGDTQTFYVNGVQVGTFTDSTWSTATQHGLGSYSSVSFRYDDFKVYVAEGETGSVEEITAGSTPISDADTGAAADAGESLAAALADADTGSAADAGESASTALQDAETGAGSDAGESVAAALTDTESGSSDESGAVAVATSDADTAAGAESEALAAALADAEAGSSSDAGEALAVGLTETETGSSIDTESALAAALTDAETGSAVDAESSASSISDTETGLATDDDGAVAAAVTDTETGSSAEGQSLAVLVTDADIAGFFEEESVAAYLQDADTGSAVDAGESLVIVLPNVRGHIDVDSTNTGAVATARAGTGLVQITAAPGPTSLVLSVAGAAITTSSQSSGRISIDVQEAPQ